MKGCISEGIVTYLFRRKMSTMIHWRILANENSPRAKLHKTAVRIEVTWPRFSLGASRIQV
jgi:hypothetical protein